MHVPSNKEEPVSRRDLTRTGDVEEAFYMAHVTDFGQLEDPHVKHQNMHISSGVTGVHINFLPAAIFFSAFLFVLLDNV